MAASDNLHPQQFSMPLDIYRKGKQAEAHKSARDHIAHHGLTMPLELYSPPADTSKSKRDKLVSDPMSGAHRLGN